MHLLRILSLCLWVGAVQASAPADIRLLIQTSPLAGSQYYAVGTYWQQLRVGDELSLQREPDNRHDANAIRVHWQGQQLGYLPRAQNRAVAAAMDRGERLVARIARLTEHPDPWRRVVLEVYAVL